MSMSLSCSVAQVKPQESPWSPPLSCPDIKQTLDCFPNLSAPSDLIANALPLLMLPSPLFPKTVTATQPSYLPSGPTSFPAAKGMTRVNVSDLSFPA